MKKGLIKSENPQLSVDKLGVFLFVAGEGFEPPTFYIRMSVVLFTTEIYAHWVRKEELERWV